MAAGGLAGLLQITVTTPMELLKIQLQRKSYSVPLTLELDITVAVENYISDNFSNDHAII